MKSRIIDLQRGLSRQLPELGRIRCGEQVATANGGTRPKALGTFRITSDQQSLVVAVADQWGGDPVPSPTLPGQWEVVTATNELECVLPPSDMAFSQAFEQWGRGFCTARCDGAWDVVNDHACTCDPEAPKCKIHTRVNVMLPRLPGIGVWRVETQGFYAASEIAATISVIRSIAGTNLVPAVLRLRQRKQQTIVNGKPDTRNFVVLGLDLATPLAELGNRVAIGTGGEQGPATPGVVAPAPADRVGDLPDDDAAPPVPTYKGRINQAALPTAPIMSVEDQMAEVERATPPKKRRGSAPIAPTNVPPRPASQVDPQVCEICGNPYGTDPLKRNPGKGSKFVHVACADQMDTPAKSSPASQGEGQGDRGGTSTGTRSAGGPAPVAAARPSATTAKPVTLDFTQPRGASHKQFAALMAATARIVPREDNETTEHLENRRRDLVLDLAGICGQPGLGSRKDLWARTAGRLLDLIAAIEVGAYNWTDGGDLVRVDTGEVVTDYEGE